MYILDTNVLSEVMKATPDPAVVDWLTACPAEAMFTTAICQTEIFYGIRRMPDGQKRYRLTAAAQALFTQEFTGRVLPFDTAAASVYADLRIARERAGRPLTLEDGMIAAIALGSSAPASSPATPRALPGVASPSSTPGKQVERILAAFWSRRLCAHPLKRRLHPARSHRLKRRSVNIRPPRTPAAPVHPTCDGLP
jgi:predicted nucleic acid-binding protein